MAATGIDITTHEPRTEVAVRAWHVTSKSQGFMLVSVTAAAFRICLHASTTAATLATTVIVVVIVLVLVVASVAVVAAAVVVAQATCGYREIRWDCRNPRKSSKPLNVDSPNPLHGSLSSAPSQCDQVGRCKPCDTRAQG